MSYFAYALSVAQTWWFQNSVTEQSTPCTNYIYTNIREILYVCQSIRPFKDPVSRTTLALHRHIIPLGIGMKQGVNTCL